MAYCVGKFGTQNYIQWVGDASRDAAGNWVCGAGTAVVLSIAEANMGTKVELRPYVATGDDYAAVSVIFGAVLVAACCIWGAKQVLRMFRDRGEE